MDHPTKSKPGRLTRRFTMRHSNPVLDGTRLEVRARTEDEIWEKLADILRHSGVVSIRKGWSE